LVDEEVQAGHISPFCLIIFRGGYLFSHLKNDIGCLFIWINILSSSQKRVIKLAYGMAFAGDRNL
jgi:hypothetical protein